MTKHYDVTALGEVLIDFTENGSSAQGNPMYEANPGGAPCNVLAMLQKFGHKTAFLGKVGEDIFGRRLEIVLKEAGIDTAWIRRCARRWRLWRKKRTETVIFLFTGIRARI